MPMTGSLHLQAVICRSRGGISANETEEKNYFSNSLIIHLVKTKEIRTVRAVWKSDLN